MTNFTRKRFLACMAARMPDKIRSSRETSATDHTRIWSLACVRAIMDIQCGLHQEVSNAAKLKEYSVSTEPCERMSDCISRI